MLAGIPAAPPTLVATEGWPPNVAVARRNLAALGARVVAVDAARADLPFEDAAFDLVVSRHPVAVRWDEVARVLKPGGTYLSQNVGHASVRELAQFLHGPQPDPSGPTRAPKWSVLAAQRAGIKVVNVREFSGAMRFHDIAAVVHFLRKVVWIVPGFTVERYRDRLRALHEQIDLAGPFPATSERFHLQAYRPRTRRRRQVQGGPKFERWWAPAVVAASATC